jgi:general secretion pathway protein H
MRPKPVIMASRPRLPAPCPGRRGVYRAQRASESGLTLIELMIAVLIVGGLMALVVPSMQSVTGMRVREEAGRLAGTIGYLYNHTAITGRTCRLVFGMNVEGGDGWAAECTDEPPRLDPEQLRVRRGVVERSFRDDEDERWTRAVRDEDALERRIKERARWQQFASRSVQPVRLSTGVEIGGVWTPRFSEPVTEGEAHLYFFPAGETQRALIYLVDARENAYTLDVQPLTGRVRVLSGWEEVPRD